MTSGALAVLEIEKGIREMNPYDIVLVDLKMPDMDGIQTTKAIRRLVGAETLVVVMTAYEWKELEQMQGMQVWTFLSPSRCSVPSW